ncbi:hypothetical protein Tco_0397705, partial [Tanacetum coccineum]
QNVNTVRAKGFNAVKPLACWVWRPIKPNGASLSNSQLNDKGFVDSGCSRHMTGNIAHLSDFKDFDGGYVTFCGGAYGGQITSKCTIKTDNLDFDDVYFVKELKFNLFSVSQMCDKKNYVLFTDSEYMIFRHIELVPLDSSNRDGGAFSQSCPEQTKEEEEAKRKGNMPPKHLSFGFDPSASFIIAFHGLESKVMRECYFVVVRDAWLRDLIGKLTLSLLDVLQRFSFIFQMGFTLILATLDGLDVGLLGDVIGEDDYDDDG